MANRESHHQVASDGSMTLQALEVSAESPRHRDDRYDSRIKNWPHRVIEQRHKWFSAQPGEEFRTDESVREQHFLASLPRDDWRVPYGVDGYTGWQLMREIECRRKHGISLDGLMWLPSDDPYAPANDPNHPYYLPKEWES
jgi:hypothetical protein